MLLGTHFALTERRWYHKYAEASVLRRAALTAVSRVDLSTRGLSPHSHITGMWLLSGDILDSLISTSSNSLSISLRSEYQGCGFGNQLTKWQY